VWVGGGVGGRAGGWVGDQGGAPAKALEPGMAAQVLLPKTHILSIYICAYAYIYIYI